MKHRARRDPDVVKTVTTPRGDVYEVVTRGSEEPWTIRKNGKFFKHLWTWREVDHFLALWAGEGGIRFDNQGRMVGQDRGRKSRRDYVVPPPGSKPMRSYLLAVERAKAEARTQGRPVPVIDDRTGRQVYLARDAMRGGLGALRKVDSGWAHSIPKDELPRSEASALADRGWIRLVDTRRGWRWAVTSSGSWALGTFEGSRDRRRPRWRKRRR